MPEQKATVQGRRNARQALDRNIASAATPPIQRLFRKEQKRVEAAVADTTTEASWIAAATGAVSDAEWVAVIVSLWLSKPLIDVFDRQQTELGTSFSMPTDVRRILTGYATEHGKSIADTTRKRLTRIGNGEKADRLSPDRVFRSTRRRALNTLYTDAIGDRAAEIAITESLQATETVRYESARISSERTKHQLRKVWFTVGDAKVRPTHQAVNGKSRVVSHRGWGGRPGKFLVGGALLRMPRDPAGPPGEVINCRCFLEYRKVRRKT